MNPLKEGLVTTFHFDVKKQRKNLPTKRTESTEWKQRYKEAYYDYQRINYPSVCEIGGMALITSYPQIHTHKGLEQAAYNYIKWIGGACTETPTVGTPRMVKEMQGGKLVNVQKGWLKAKGGKGKSDVDIIYKGCNVKIDFKVGKDKQSDAQIKYMERIRKAGGFYFLVHNMHELYAIVDWIDEHGTLVNFGNNQLF